MRTLLAILLLLTGCARCNEADHEDPRVPFKLTKSENNSARDAGAKPPAVRVAEAMQHEPPLDALMIDGDEVSLAKMIASLAVDVDADGDRDALLIRREEGKAAELYVALRNEKGFEPARRLTELTADSGCEQTELKVSALSASKALVSALETCAQAKNHLQKLWFFSLESAPRALERFVALSEDIGRSLVLTPESRDIDDDGHDDVLLSVALTTQDLAETAGTSLAFLDRPFGLARDVREPEATLTALTAGAHNSARKAPEKARAGARAVLALKDALCKEPRRSLLRVGDRNGIECKLNAIIPRTLASIVLSSVALKDVRGAVDAYLDLTKATGAEKSLQEALTALTNMKATDGVVMKPGPEVTKGTGSYPTLPSARFVTDALLYVRRDAPIVFDLDHATEAPAPLADDRIRDPQGVFYVRGVRSTCNALVVDADRVDAVNTPGMNKSMRSYPLLPFTKDPACRDTGARNEDLGYRVLGFAPQGVLVAKGSEVRLAPVSADGNPTSEPRVLGPEVARPAPIALGMATADAASYVYALPFGVVIFSPKGAELWRPAGYQDLAASVSEASISPSAKRVAIVVQGRVQILEKAPSEGAKP